MSTSVATSMREKVRVALRQGEGKGSLLQLARQDTETVPDEAADTSGVGYVGASSVITQVTSRGPVVSRHTPSDGTTDAPVTEARSTWKNKFRSLLCCLAPPSNDQYFPHREVPPPIIRAPRPPSPARYAGAAVLGPIRPEDVGKKTLVLDLDETLVHSSFKPIPNPDYIIPVEIEGKIIDVYVLKRPWMDHFMEVIGSRFEIVVFTASLSKYADPLLDLLDKTSVVRWRLFRESCCPYEGNYVKDLNCLGRDLSHTIIVDNSPHSYVFQPENAVPIGTFIDDMEEQELLDILPVLLALENVTDVREHLAAQLQSLKRTLSRRAHPLLSNGGSGSADG